MIKPLLRSLLLSASLLCSFPAMAENDSIALNSKLSVAGQMTADKFSALLKQHHFKSVIVNRPDQEQGMLLP